MGIAFNALQKDWNQLEVKYQKESEEWKKVEEKLDKA